MSDPARRSGWDARGGSWNNPENNARCAYRNRKQLDNRNNHIGGMLRSARTLPFFFWFRPQRDDARRDHRRRSATSGRPDHSGSSPAAKEEEQRQTRLVRASREARRQNPRHRRRRAPREYRARPGRNVDDFALFGDSKSTLCAWKQAIISRLAEDRLTLYEAEAQVLPTRCGIP